MKYNYKILYILSILGIFIYVSEATEFEYISENLVLLDVPIDFQDQSLSCEAASLKMALVNKDIVVSEDELMGKIGFDPTPKTDIIWGDPDKAFVGNINGKMCRDGYGVHWNPVANIATEYASTSQSFTDWKAENLVEELSKGNTVMLWGIIPTGKITNCSWYTKNGKKIDTYKETHVRVVVGYVGPKDNPIFILNDSIYGRLFWSKDFLIANAQYFDFSGVVVR